MSAPALASPPSPGILLHPGEGARRGGGHVAGERHAGDDLRCGIGILALAVGSRPVPGSWATATFAREVGRARAQLAPIDDPAVLARCFEGEAFLRDAAAEGGDPRPIDASPVRVAYALRYAEVALGLRLPAWSMWLGPGTVAGGPPRCWSHGGRVGGPP
jgi:hypothetical protein